MTYEVTKTDEQWKSELDQIKADIISGKIKPATKSPA